MTGALSQWMRTGITVLILELAVQRSAEALEDGDVGAVTQREERQTRYELAWQTQSVAFPDSKTKSSVHNFR